MVLGGGQVHYEPPFVFPPFLWDGTKGVQLDSLTCYVSCRAQVDDATLFQLFFDIARDHFRMFRRREEISGVWPQVYTVFVKPNSEALLKSLDYQGCEHLVWVSEQLRAPEIGKYGCCETGCLPSDPNRAIP